ncbi:hypothetical protein [Stenotrophomonas sp. SY1]|uniref:hypothetical protein n=1 Tax=Stenotrophomonas sp. SY1 TaxID=477235 RepID=UPI001E440E87|nr:hypothetical protein [Stenotrophomonas sp. SY1]MCD9087372.1 hypothetical protein [Stenotrophomonas sp. SY1]
MGDWTVELLKLGQITGPAVIGLFGVVVGAGLTSRRERNAEARKAKKDAALLAAIIGGELDKFISSCADVAQDDGTVDPTSGFWDESTAVPSFDPSKFAVEWRSIDEKIMFDIHDLPYQIGFSNGAISDAAEHDSPPDFPDWFEERQYQYARLGLHCVDIVARLRTAAKLRPRPKTFEWKPEVIFQAKIDKIEAQRAKRDQAELV